MSVGRQSFWDGYLDPSRVGTFEKHRGLVRLTSLVRCIAPSRGPLLESVARYARILDVVADESPRVRPALDALEDERIALVNGCPSQLQRELLQPALREQPPAAQAGVLRSLAELLDSMLWDARARLRAYPDSRMAVRQRNIQSCRAAFNSLAIGLVGSELRASPRLDAMCDGFASYDNLLDLGEDLSHGLILVSREDAVRFGLAFVPSAPIDPHALNRYVRWKRKEVGRALRASPLAVMHSGMPPWASVLCAGYLLSAAARVTRLRVDTRRVVFHAAHDAIEG